MQLRKIPHLLFLFFFLCGLGASAQRSFTLQEALQTAKNNNPHLKSEYFDLGISQTDLTTAKLRPNPVLSNETLQLARSSEFAANTEWYRPENREVLWQLSKSFQIMGQRRHKIDVANNSITFTENNYADIERNLLSEVAQKWLEVWTVQKQLDLLEIAKGNIDSLVITNQHRYRNEVITQTDLFRTELLAKQYALQYNTEKQDLINSQKELQFLLGVQDSVNIAMDDEFVFMAPASLEDMLARSLENRSDIQTAKSYIDISGSNIELQKSLAYPQPELGVIWNPQSTIPYFGISAAIDLPFFDRNQGEVKKSKILKEQAEQRLYTLESKLQTEISTANASFQLQQRNLQDFSSVLEQSQVILDNVKYAYLQGGTTIIDFLEAQRSWLETQQQYYDAMQQYRQSHIQLLYAAGLIHQLAQ